MAEKLGTKENNEKVHSVEVDVHQVEPEDIMEDQSVGWALKPVGTPHGAGQEGGRSWIRVVSAHVNKFWVLDHLLGTRVELSVGKVFMVSKELSVMLTDAIKLSQQVQFQ